jgi:hypothetical protein
VGPWTGTSSSPSRAGIFAPRSGCCASSARYRRRSTTTSSTLRVDDPVHFPEVLSRHAGDLPLDARAALEGCPRVRSPSASPQSRSSRRRPARLVLGYRGELGGKRFHVRVHRRGFKGRIVTPEQERFSGRPAPGCPRPGLEHPGRSPSTTQTSSSSVETVGNQAGVSRWTREDPRALPLPEARLMATTGKIAPCRGILLLRSLCRGPLCVPGHDHLPALPDPELRSQAARRHHPHPARDQLRAGRGLVPAARSVPCRSIPGSDLRPRQRRADRFLACRPRILQEARARRPARRIPGIRPLGESPARRPSPRRSPPGTTGLWGKKGRRRRPDHPLRPIDRGRRRLRTGKAAQDGGNDPHLHLHEHQVHGRQVPLPSGPAQDALRQPVHRQRVPEPHTDHPRDPGHDHPRSAMPGNCTRPLRSAACWRSSAGTTTAPWTGRSSSASCSGSSPEAWHCRSRARRTGQPLPNWGAKPLSDDLARQARTRHQDNTR